MFSKRARLWLGLIAAASLLSLASSCSPKTETPGGDETSTSTAPPASKGDEGTISGKISFTGAAPEAKKIDTSADAACTSKSPNLTTEDWAVKDGKLANTFVYIKDGTIDGAKKIGDYTWPAPSGAVVLDQNGCHYKPHDCCRRSGPGVITNLLGPVDGPVFDVNEGVGQLAVLHGPVFGRE